MKNPRTPGLAAALRWLILPAFLLVGIWVPVLVSNASQGHGLVSFSAPAKPNDTETPTATVTSTLTVTATSTGTVTPETTVTVTGTPLLTGTPTATATGPATEEAGKVTLCHRTGSEHNPYVQITVGASAVPAHEAHGDIVPAPAGGCPAATTATPSVTGSPTASPSVTATGTAVAQKVTICHATGSASHPYSLITISVSGLNGHNHHTGDIIPAPATGCPAAIPLGTNSGQGKGVGNGNGNGVGNGNGNGHANGNGNGNGNGHANGNGNGNNGNKGNEKGNGNGNGNGKGHK